MCISPDQLTNRELELHIQQLQDIIDAGRYPQYQLAYERRIKAYEALLKERAESGEYVNY